MNRSTWVAVAALAALAAAWYHVRPAGQEVVTLRTFDAAGADRFTTLWSFADGRVVWIRANRTDRTWLTDLRQNPDVELNSRGHKSQYVAALYDRARSEGYVEAGFRTKYGWADQWREWTTGNDTTMIRLVPR